MAFNKRLWKGRQGTGLNKFSINGATPVTVINQPDSVTEQGDALSAGNLNDLEDRIDNAFEEIADGTQVVGKATADASGNVITDTYETKADASELKDAIDAVEEEVANTSIWAIDQQAEVTFEGNGAGTWEIMERQIPTEPNDGIFLCMDSSAPSSSSSTGLKGQFYMDANYLYLCIADNTWRRVALSTF